MQEVKELKEKLDAANSELQAQRSLEESLETKIQRLKAEKEEAVKQAQVSERRVKEVEDQMGALKSGKLTAESKLLEVEVAHASCKTHIADLVSSVAKKERALKEWEDAWRLDRAKLMDDVADSFNAGVDQVKAYLQERHQTLGVDWRAISLDDILAVGGDAEGGDGERGDDEGLDVVKKVGGGDPSGVATEKEEVKKETKSGGVIIKGID